MTAAVRLGALIADTFRESLARKIFLGFWGCSSAVLLLLLTVLNIDIVEGSIAAVTIFGEDVGARRAQGAQVEDIVNLALGGLAAFLFSIGLLLAIFASAGLIPTIFAPGRIELLLSKPLSRSELLLGKYLGALTVIGANIAYLVVGAWLILGWKTSIWKLEFLASGALAIYAFAVILTVVTLTATASNSAVLSTMVAYVVLVISSIVSQHERIAPLFNSQWPRDLVKATYLALPKVFEIGDLSRRLMGGREIESWVPLWSSGLFALVALGLSMWVFERKDY